MVHGQRLEDDEALKRVTAGWEKKKQEVDEATKRLTKAQDELNQLNITLRQVEEYNEQMKAEIQVTRRATYKSEDHIKEIEQIKHKQDVLLDNMNEDVKRMTEQKALLDAQLVAQKQETEAAVATLREAAREMEAIEFEKKQLMQQWRSSLVGMQRRDEALQNVWFQQCDWLQRAHRSQFGPKGLAAPMAATPSAALVRPLSASALWLVVVSLRLPAQPQTSAQRRRVSAPVQVQTQTQTQT